MYNYYYLKEYLPKRYSADIQQEQDREIVYAFKNGELSESIKKSFLDKIKEITGNSKSEWVVCFIPGSTEHKTSIRFSKLADAIRKEGYSVEQKPYLINMTKMQVILQEKPAIQLNHLDLTELES